LRVPTDVVWFSEPAFCVAATDFFNPAVGGAQVVIPGIAEGTLSCMVRNAAGQTFAVTAAHVVMGGTVGGVPIGRVVMQPRILPRGLPVTTSIQLGRTRGGTFGNILDGFVDFCLIELRQGRTGLSVPFDSGPFSGQILSPNQVFGSTIPITKLGAVTGRTAGVFSRSVTEEIINGVPVRNVFEFKGLGPGIFCSIGDSGALVTTINGAVIGILFAVMAPTPDAPFGRGFVFPFSRMGFGIV
jgi:hypothetical protein